MQQSSVIAASLLIGYLVFITARGELGKYLGVIGLGNQSQNPTATNTSNTTQSTGVTGLSNTFSNELDSLNGSQNGSTSTNELDSLNTTDTNEFANLQD